MGGEVLEEIVRCVETRGLANAGERRVDRIPENKPRNEPRGVFPETNGGPRGTRTRANKLTPPDNSKSEE